MNDINSTHFPKPKPYSGKRDVPVVECIENKDGYFIRSQKSYDEADVELNQYIKNCHIPDLKDHSDLTESEINEIEQRGVGPRPSTEDLNAFEDLIYANWEKRALVLDLYTPKKTKHLVPVILVVHGGSWVSGSHRNYRNFAMKLAKKGYATACVEYRLAGEAGFPAAIYDIKAATRWLRANAVSYQIDPEKVCITGGSAGGKLACLAALTNGDSRYEGPSNHLEQSSDIQCMMIMDGLVDGRVNGIWLNDSKDAELINETTPYHHVVHRTKHFPIMLFINDADKTHAWLKEHRKDAISQLVKTSLAHGYELLDAERDTVITWMYEFLKKHL